MTHSWQTVLGSVRRLGSQGWLEGWLARGRRARTQKAVGSARKPGQGFALRRGTQVRTRRTARSLPHPLDAKPRAAPCAAERHAPRASRAFRNQWLRKRSFCESASGQLEIARRVLLIVWRETLVVERNLNRSTTVDKPACVPTRTRRNTQGSWNLILT